MADRGRRFHQPPSFLPSLHFVGCPASSAKKQLPAEMKQPTLFSGWMMDCFGEWNLCPRLGRFGTYHEDHRQVPHASRFYLCPFSVSCTMFGWREQVHLSTWATEPEGLSKKTKMEKTSRSSGRNTDGSTDQDLSKARVWTSGFHVFSGSYHSLFCFPFFFNGVGISSPFFHEPKFSCSNIALLLLHIRSSVGKVIGLRVGVTALCRKQEKKAKARSWFFPLPFPNNWSVQTSSSSLGWWLAVHPSFAVGIMFPACQLNNFPLPPSSLLTEEGALHSTLTLTRIIWNFLGGWPFAAAFAMGPNQPNSPAC